MIEARSKRLSLIGLGVLMAVLGIVALGVAGRGMYDRYLGGHRNVPTILILSHYLVHEGITVNEISDGKEKAGDSDKILTKQLTDDIVSQSEKAGGKVIKADAHGNSSASQPGNHVARNAQLQLLLLSMEDAIGISASDALKHSHLFNPIAGGLVSGQLAQLHATQDTVVAKAGGLATKNADIAHEKAISEKKIQIDSSIKVMAENVGAQYVMTIEVVEPNVRAKILAPDKANNTVHVEFTARPIIHVEVFSADGKGFSEAKELVLPNTIRREVSLSFPIIDTNLETDVSSAAEEINLEIHKKVGQAVAAWLVNEVSPARVVASDGAQFTIDRGSSDGVKQGAVYSVLREVGDDITGSGVDGNARDLGKKRIPVGSVTIATVDTLKSVATTLSGGPFQNGDIVMMSGTGSDGSSSTDAAAPLGTRELAQSGTAAGSRVKLAVDDIVLNNNGHATYNTELAELISEALARDPRVTVIPRSQMQDVLGERSLNAQGSSDDDGGGMTGMSTSNYLVSGSFSAQSSRHVTSQSISVGGVSETVSRSASTSTAVSGTLRVMSTSGVLKFSTSVGGSSPQAVAQAAARALLIQLFPMQVIQVNGSEVVLDRGQDANLKVGTRLSLFHVGKPIVDKLTGAVHEGLRIPAGEVVVQAVQPTISTAGVQGSGSAQEGDIVLVGGAGDAAPGGQAQSGTPASPRPATHHAGRARSTSAPPTNDGLHF